MQTILINLNYFDYIENLDKSNLSLEYRHDAN
jgi:hypothetical protein